MKPDGSAIIATPNKEDNMLTKRPMSVTGVKSPYPTIVRVTVAQYRASKKGVVNLIQRIICKITLLRHSFSKGFSYMIRVTLWRETIFLF